MVCGMGGSAIGGDLAAAALGDRLTRPLVTVRGYELPSWATPEWTVLCSSYSGNTEETLACFAAAEALGARRLVASTGGAAGRAGARGRRAGGRPAGDLPAARRGRLHVRRRRRGRGAGRRRAAHPHRDRRRRGLPRARSARRCRSGPPRSPRSSRAPSPVVYGADLTAPVARRWKTQINENAKLPAFFSELPEADHNEICGWWRGRRRALAAVFLEDRDQHPRERRRFELTAEAVGGRRRRRGAGGDRGRDPGRAPALGDDAGRPRLARAGRAARRRPAAGRGDRALQGGAWGGMRAMVLAAGPRHPAAADHLRRCRSRWCRC